MATAVPTGDATTDVELACDAMTTPLSSFSIAETSPAMIAATDACPALPGTDEEIARTPRARPDLEQLVMHLTHGFTASDDAYRRVERDVTAMSGCSELLKWFRYRPFDDGKTVNLRVDAPTATAIDAGSYSAWDCINARYDVRSIHIEVGEYAVLETKGTYATALLAEAYRHLPGVLDVYSSGPMIGDGSTICLRAPGDAWDYLLVRKGGDCPAGCTETDWYWFTTTAAGNVDLRGKWGAHEGAPTAIDPSILAFAETCER